MRPLAAAGHSAATCAAACCSAVTPVLAGAVDDRVLEARPDVLAFTSEPFTRDVQVIGPVTTRLSRRAPGQQFGIFTRLCYVDLRGRSRNGCAGCQ